MNLFRSVLFGKDLTNCEEFYNELKCHTISRMYPRFLRHVEKYWMRREEWAYTFRHSLCTRGNNTNNIVESSIRIFKDIVLERCKSFNACALVDFVCNVFESYHKRKLMRFASSRNTKPELAYLKLTHKAKDLIVTQITDIEFYVQSSNDRNLLYLVDTEMGLCDCPEGNGGKFCKHLCAVDMYINRVLKKSPVLSANDKALCAQLAWGDSYNPSFYVGMMEVEHTECGSDKDKNVFEPPRKIPKQIPVLVTVAVSSDILAKYELSVNELQKNYLRLFEKAKSTYSPSLHKVICKLNKSVKHVESLSQIETLFATTMNEIGKRRIPVQPTSLSRRKRRAGMKCGASVIQAGRPTNIESPKVTKKRARNLGKNISLNQANAKSHGIGH